MYIYVCELDVLESMYVQMCKCVNVNSWSSSICRSQRSIDETETHLTYSHSIRNWKCKILNNAKAIECFAAFSVFGFLIPFQQHLDWHWRSMENIVFRISNKGSLRPTHTHTHHTHGNTHCCTYAQNKWSYFSKHIWIVCPLWMFAER